MTGNKILLVSDGIIVVVTQQFDIQENLTDVELEIAEYGAILTVEDHHINLPGDVLNHLEQSEGSNVYFYEASPYELIAEFRGCITLERDEILKLKGAYEYRQRL